MATVLKRDLNSSKKKYSTNSRKICTNQKTKQPPRNSTRCHVAPNRRSGKISIQNTGGTVPASAANRSRGKPLKKASSAAPADSAAGLKARSSTSRRTNHAASSERNQKQAKP